jgi:hypothetical protein
LLLLMTLKNKTNMIDVKFKLWLNESTASEYEEYLVSWLSSFGEFIPTKENNKVMTHLDFAKELVPDASSPENARDTLFEKGYMRVNFSNGILYANNPYVMPNRRQIEHLKDFAIELNKIQEYDFIKEIAYDNDRSTQVIWSIQDV